MPERSFTFQDQEVFATLSRDFNPMHVDPEAARRLPLGRPVVHGIHAVLWALEQWLAPQSEPLALARLDVQFRAPIGTGDRVALDWTEGPGDGTETRLTLAVAGRRTT
jgi:acyl dehydratase